jgi:nitronate monooxygenase
VISTRFTDGFGVALPILSAPMAMHTDGVIAAAASQAGALGSFGAMHTEHPTSWVGDQISLIRERTDRSFAVGFITPFIRFFEDRFDLTLDAGVPVIVLSFSDPSPWLARAHDAGAQVICQVQTHEQARVAIASGADAIAVQGNEAGGHTGTMGLLPFLAAVCDEDVNVPVLAAGGIGDGRTLAGVLAAGADGAVVGTALLAAAETPVPDELKDLIVASDGSDTVWTRAYDLVGGAPWPEGIGERVHANAFTEQWEGREDELRARREEIAATLPRPETFDRDESAALYGPAAAFVANSEPVSRVLTEMVTSAERHLRDVDRLHRA